MRENDQNISVVYGKATSKNAIVRVEKALAEPDKLNCLHHLYEGMLQAAGQLHQIEEKRHSTSIFSLCKKDSYLELAKSLVYNNVRVGGYLPYRCFVMLILELMLTRKGHLISCLNDLEKKVGKCAQSRDLISTLKSYVGILKRCFSTEGVVLQDEIALFFVTSSLFNETKSIVSQVTNKYRMATKKDIRSQKQISGSVDSKVSPGTVNNALWEGKHVLVAYTMVLIWSLSITVRLKEIDLAINLLKRIPQSMEKHAIVRQVKAFTLAEKGRDIYRTDGSTDEVYEFLIDSLSYSYSGDIVHDISNCLLGNFKPRVLRHFRPGGKFYNLLDVRGKVCITELLPLDESIRGLEGLIDEAIKERDDVIVQCLSQRYYEKDLIEKAYEFIEKMGEIEWDFEKSGKCDHVLQARFDLAINERDYKNAVVIGEQFLRTYKRNRVTFLGHFFYRLAQAYFNLGKYRMAKKYCNKGLKYNADCEELWELKEQVRAKKTQH